MQKQLKTLIFDLLYLSSHIHKYIHKYHKYIYEYEYIYIYIYYMYIYIYNIYICIYIQIQIDRQTDRQILLRPLLQQQYEHSGPSRSSFDLSCANELSKSETAAACRLISYIYIIQIVRQMDRQIDRQMDRYKSPSDF